MNATEHLEDCKWVRPDSYMGHNPVGDYVVYTQNRDSSILEEVNYKLILKQLLAIATDDDKDNSKVYDFRASHWGCGWIEYIIVAQGASDRVLELAGEIVCSLADYPILSDSAYSEAQAEATYNYWSKNSISERMYMCRDAKVSIFSARNEETPEQVELHLQETMFY